MIFNLVYEVCLICSWLTYVTRWVLQIEFCIISFLVMNNNCEFHWDKWFSFSNERISPFLFKILKSWVAQYYKGTNWAVKICSFRYSNYCTIILFIIYLAVRCFRYTAWRANFQCVTPCFSITMTLPTYKLWWFNTGGGR